MRDGIQALDDRVREHEYALALVRAWDASTPAERRAGRAWYPQARSVADALALEHGTSRETAAGVIAALSPRIQWAVNVRAAGAVLAHAPTIPAAFAANVRTAERIRDGVEPLSAMRGPKVREFHAAIMGDPDAAVVDVWMARVMGESRALTPKRYASCASAIRSAARMRKVPPAVLQATVWTRARGRAE